MGTVTIAATYGAGGSVIGPAVARRLKVPFVDRAISPALAEKIHKPLMAALANDSEGTGAVGRLLNRALSFSGLLVGVPMAPEELGVRSDVAHTEVAIRRLSETGGAVILGRGGVFVLKGRPGVFHVRVDGDVEARRRAAMKRKGLDYKTASRVQHETDQARRAYITHFYPRAGAWEDPRHYHMVLDSTTIPLETCVELITRAAEDVFAQEAEPHASRRKA
jgi:cytidylate kinase